ncbi:TPA: helix-turn-helix domain-containing protein, partial [Streptococcus pneumoniae]
MAKNSPQDLKNREYFSNNLNRVMKEKGIRQIDLHNALEIPKSTITGYVKGRSMPTSGNLQKLADYLGVK